MIDLPTALQNPVIRAAIAEQYPDLVPQPVEKVRTHGHPEADLQDKIIACAKLQGWTVAHFRAVRIQRGDGTCYYATPVQAEGEGFPDLVMLRGKRGIAAECKAGRNLPTARQVMWLNLFKEAGFETYVWYPKHWDKIVKVLEV